MWCCVRSTLWDLFLFLFINWDIGMHRTSVVWRLGLTGTFWRQLGPRPAVGLERVMGRAALTLVACPSVTAHPSLSRHPLPPLIAADYRCLSTRLAMTLSTRGTSRSSTAGSADFVFDFSKVPGVIPFQPRTSLEDEIQDQPSRVSSEHDMVCPFPPFVRVSGLTGLSGQAEQPSRL